MNYIRFLQIFELKSCEFIAPLSASGFLIFLLASHFFFFVFTSVPGNRRSADFEVCEISFAQIFAVHQVFKLDLAEFGSVKSWNELLKLNECF